MESPKITAESPSIDGCQELPSPTGPITQNQEVDKLQEVAPKWVWFLDEYVADLKPRILTLDPNDRKVKRKARILLMELLFSTIDAAADDINDTFQRRKRQSSQWSTASSRSGRNAGTKIPEVPDDGIDSMLGDMPEDEGSEMDETAKKMKVLGQIVKAELEELAEAAKESIEDMI